MTITMNPSIFPSALTSGPELGKEALQEFADLGLLTKIDNHREHYAIQPCWIQDPASGVLEEINKNVLGRWNNKLNSYVVAVHNIRNYDNSAGMNEDHRWLHVDIVATYYTFSPEEGQRLKGEIKKVGNRASICIIFDVFTATVFAKDDEELGSWNVGDELRFEIYSFVHRRKGPLIRAKSLSESTSNKRKLPALDAEDWETEQPVVESNSMEVSFNESGDLEEESRSSRKEKKKKKKKIKQELDDSVQDNDVMQETLDWSHEDVVSQDNNTTVDDDDGHSRKKKKKKKSSKNE